VSIFATCSALYVPFFQNKVVNIPLMNPRGVTCKPSQSSCAIVIPNAIVPSAVLQSNSGILLRVYKMALGRVRICSSLILNYTDHVHRVRKVQSFSDILYIATTFADYVFVWNVVVINISFVIEVVEDILSALVKVTIKI
jgi:hypothetical protein